MMNRSHKANLSEIEKLDREIAACRICYDKPLFMPPLPHEPRPVAYLSSTARIVIAGQAAGMRVHNTGIPFNDPSGERLREWLGVNRECFYVLPLPHPSWRNTHWIKNNPWFESELLPTLKKLVVSYI